MPPNTEKKNFFLRRILTLPSYQVTVEKILQTCKVSKNVAPNALLGHNRRICSRKTRG